VHDQTYGKYRHILEELLEQMADAGDAPKLKLKNAAIGLCALLDGLWVELSLSSATFKPNEAIAICEDWVTALCNGAFPRLHAAGGAKRVKSAKKRRGN
jgi:hypothetical protein